MTYEQVKERLANGTGNDRLPVAEPLPTAISTPAVIQQEHDAIAALREALAAKDLAIAAMDETIRSQRDTIDAQAATIRWQERLVWEMRANDKAQPVTLRQWIDTTFLGRILGDKEKSAAPNLEGSTRRPLPEQDERSRVPSVRQDRRNALCHLTVGFATVGPPAPTEPSSMATTVA